MTLSFLCKTSADGVIFSPPYVKVIPQIVGYASKGGLAMGSAQLLFGGVIPNVDFPSRRNGWNSPSRMDSLN